MMTYVKRHPVHCMAVVRVVIKTSVRWRLDRAANGLFWGPQWHQDARRRRDNRVRAHKAARNVGSRRPLFLRRRDSRINAWKECGITQLEDGHRIVRDHNICSRHNWRNRPLT